MRLKMYDIISIGSANIDVFIKSKSEIINHNGHQDIAYLLGGKTLIKKISFLTGGGGTNTAVAFSRLGLKTAFIGVIGEDPNGQLILNELKRERVDFLGNIKDGKTGYSIILQGEKDRSILAFKGLNNELNWKDINHSLVKTKWIYLSTMLDKSFRTSEKLAIKLKKTGVKIALNLSPYLAEKGMQYLSRILKITDVLILNKEESELLTKKENLHEILGAITQYMKGIIVITNGSKTIHAYHWKRNFIKKIKPLKPVNSAGAGDAFASGFIYGIIKGKSIKDSLIYGHKEASSVLKHLGAKSGLLRKL